MANTKTKHQDGIDLIEDPSLLAGKAEAFFNDSKNRNLVFGIGGVLALLVIGFLGYKLYIDNKNDLAQQEMFQAVYFFEADNFEQALNGDGINPGFLQIADEYAGTDAANLSKFYAGAAYLQMRSFTSAALQLEDFSSNDYLLQARAYSLTGDAYSELKEFDNAISAYKKAVNENPNVEFTPIYALKLAVAYEANGDMKNAAETYDMIIEKYSKSTFLPEAKKQKARLQGLAAE
jgi:tetratricopeptide (TPR) repeat protein